MSSDSVQATNPNVRIERDTMGPVEVDASRFWGAQTERSRRNFLIGGERMPVPIIHAFAHLKSVAAEVNGELLPNKMKSCWVAAIQHACSMIIDGKLDDHFPLVVWQTGSGTQTNMNLNEVIANRANAYLVENNLNGEGSIHPNDHVNMSQSSNDSFPTAMHIAAAIQIKCNLLPSLQHMHTVLVDKAKSFHGLIKVGRTHLQDATPITLEQEFHAFATQVHLGIQRIESTLPRVHTLAQGGTAVGTGINCPPGFKESFSAKLSQRLGIPFVPSQDLFESLSTHDSLVELSGQLNVLAGSFMKMANDVRLLGSGPRCGLNEIFLPENEPGSSIMPGKVNPTQAEAMTMVCAQVMGNNTTISVAGSQGHFQLNVFKPVIAYNILQSIKLISDAARSFTDNCLIGIVANEKRLQDNVNKSLMLVTALNPVIGYVNAAIVAKKAMKDDISLKEAALKLQLLTEEQFDAAVVPEKMLGEPSK